MEGEILQNLIFTNKNNESIEIITSPRSSSRNPFLLNSINGTESISMSGTALNKRMITIEFSMIAAEDENIFDLRRKVSTVFNPTLGRGILRYEVNGEAYEIEAICDSEPSFPSGSENRLTRYQKVLIFLVCDDPIWKGANAHLTVFSAPYTALFEFPFSTTEEGIEMGRVSNRYSLYNDGNISAPLIIEVDGGVERASLINLTTGEYLEIIKPISGNKKILINTETGKKEVSLLSASGVKENAFNYISTDTSYIKLAVGLNEFEFEAVTQKISTDLTLTWKNRYLGI